MIYAQIKNNLVINCIVADEETPLDIFSAGYDYFIRIDTNPINPGIGWSYDGVNFSAPVMPPDEEDVEE